MLKIGKSEKKILDMLLHKSPKLVSEELGIDVQSVYSTKHYFKKKVQNAREFLSVANSQYKSIISKRIKSPRIMPIIE